MKLFCYISKNVWQDIDNENNRKKYCTGSLNISVFPIHFSKSWQDNLHIEHSDDLVWLSPRPPLQVLHSCSHCESCWKLPGYDTQLHDFTRQPIRMQNVEYKIGTSDYWIFLTLSNVISSNSYSISVPLTCKQEEKERE